MDCHKFLLHSVEILSPFPGIATFLVHYSCHDEGVSFHFQVEKVLQMIDVDLGNCGNLIHKLCKVTLTYSFLMTQKVFVQFLISLLSSAIPFI